MKKLIIANWKLNPVTSKEAQKLSSSIDTRPKHTAVLCPPIALLAFVNYPRLGAQDCFWKAKGPYTGQVSPATLKSLKVKYCIIGHSEKRGLGETDADVNAKAHALIDQGIIPVVCIGYGTTVEQDDLDVIDALKGQLAGSLHNINPSEVVVAYEPVWAISSGDPYATKKVPTPEHAERIALFIKTKYHAGKVLYGGSVNGSNAGGFLAQHSIDGLLVGGASLLPADFNTIINL